MKFPSINKYINEDHNLITANKNSRVGVHIPDIISKYGGGVLAALRNSSSPLCI